MDNTESNFLYHSSCQACGSSDANSVYDDGHAYCFSCGVTTREENQKMQNIQDQKFIDGTVKPLTKRNLDKDTLQKFNYQTGIHKGRPVQIANYYNKDRQLVAQKLRHTDKTFQWIGESRESGLFGQHLWRDKGRMCVVTEGELDAMSLSKVQQNKFPVVSVKSGAQGAKRDVIKALEWLEGFESVIFLFDQDDAGKAGALECAKVLSPNKAKIATMPLKDANEMLLAGKTKELIDCVWSAKAYQPDGIIF